MLFKPKKMYQYKILEKCKIDIEECRNPNSPKHEYCEEVARNGQYIFYCYLQPIARFYGYILRQDIRQPKNVVFFGNGKYYNIIFGNHLFQVNQRGEYDEMYLTARNITTGELTTFSWLGQRTVFAVTPDGYGRDYNQDIVNEVYISNEQLILKGSRRKSSKSILKNPFPDKYDVTGDFTLVVEKSETGFAGKIYINEKVRNNTEIVNHLAEKGQQITPIKNNNPSNSTVSVAQKKITVDKEKVVSAQRHEALKKKYWLDEKGTVKCPGDTCPINCDTDCPIYAQTIALQKLTKNDFEGAAKLLRNAVATEPKFADAWNNLAACYGQMNDHKNAFAAYQRSYELVQEPNPLYGMVVASENMKDNVLAEMFANTYIKKFGADDRINKVLAELSENELAESIRGSSGTTPVVQQSEPVIVKPTPVKKPDPLNLFGNAAYESVVEKKLLDNMRQYGSIFLKLLVPEKREAAYAEMEKLEEQYPEAGIILGQYYIGKDNQKALKHYKVAAENGIAEAQWGYSQLLPHSYALNMSDTKDIEYLKYCLAAAEGGNPDAANEMGNICHRKGFYSEATYWYGMAFALEHPSGTSGIRGITKEWQQKGFSDKYEPHIEGFTENMHATSLLLYKMFTQTTDVKLIDDLMILALNGENLAGFVEAKLFEQHNHDDMAYKVYSALASGKHPYALRCYADMLLAGKGTEKDAKAAFRYYEQSAKAGNSVAMFAMGQKVVKEGDKDLAACWFGQAYVRGLEMASEWLSGLKGNS